MVCSDERVLEKFRSIQLEERLRGLRELDLQVVPGRLHVPSSVRRGAVPILGLPHCRRICHARWRSRTQDTSSHNDLSSSNRDSILWTLSTVPISPQDLHPTLAPHIRPQPGHAGRALSGSVPRASFCHGVQPVSKRVVKCAGAVWL